MNGLKDLSLRMRMNECYTCVDVHKCAVYSVQCIAIENKNHKDKKEKKPHILYDSI